MKFKKGKFYFEDKREQERFLKEFIENNADIPLSLFTKQSSELIIDEVLQ